MGVVMMDKRITLLVDTIAAVLADFEFDGGIEVSEAFCEVAVNRLAQGVLVA